jgi:hypothetical protein
MRFISFTALYFVSFTMVDPMDPLFQEIGQAYNKELVRMFGLTAHFYSADVFNEIDPKSR